MTGVQLIGKDAVLTAFNKLPYDFWGIYEGKTPKVFGEGADALGEWLDMFCAAGSTATYILRIYDTDSLPTSQSGGVDFVASLNFKLVDMYEGYGIAGHTTKLMQRIEGLEKKLAGSDEDEGEEEDINSILMGWLNNPEKLGMVVGAFRQLIGGGDAVPAIAGNGLQAQQTVGGFAGSGAGTAAGSDDDVRLQRLAAALDQLEKKDPRLVEHLEKLAKLDPIFFNAVIQKLDAL